MSQRDLATLRELLRRVAQETRSTSRELEERLEIGHGNLGKLLSGRIELRVRHILAFAELLEVSPGELVAAGCPEATAAATINLEDWLAPPRRPVRAATPGQTALPASAEELVELLRREIRSELAAQRSGGRGATRGDATRKPK